MRIRPVGAALLSRAGQFTDPKAQLRASAAHQVRSKGTSDGLGRLPRCVLACDPPQQGNSSLRNCGFPRTGSARRMRGLLSLTFLFGPAEACLWVAPNHVQHRVGRMASVLFGRADLLPRQRLCVSPPHSLSF